MKCIPKRVKKWDQKRGDPFLEPASKILIVARIKGSKNGPIFWAHILVAGNHFLARFWEPKIWMQTKKYRPRMQLCNSAIAV